MKKLNPGWKLLSLILASLLLSTTFRIRLNLVVAAVSLTVTLCTPGVDRRRLGLSMVPFLLAAFGMFTAGLWFGADGGTGGVVIRAFGQGTLYASSLTTAMQLYSSAFKSRYFSSISVIFSTVIIRRLFTIVICRVLSR